MDCEIASRNCQLPLPFVNFLTTDLRWLENIARKKFRLVEQIEGRVNLVDGNGINAQGNFLSRHYHR